MLSRLDLSVLSLFLIENKYRGVRYADRDNNLLSSHFFTKCIPIFVYIEYEGTVHIHLKTMKTFNFIQLVYTNI